MNYPGPSPEGGGGHAVRPYHPIAQDRQDRLAAEHAAGKSGQGLGDVDEAAGNRGDGQEPPTIATMTTASRKSRTSLVRFNPER